ncbi:M20 peptidase aminoacylase family protein [Paenibacillus pini]
MKSETAQNATALTEQLIQFRRHLHQHPELSNQEFETTKWVKAQLETAGIRIVDYSLKTGVVAEIGGQKQGPIIALRADIDALPIQEETGLSYASLVPGKMHACGHDFHTAALLGTAILLKEQEHELRGTVRLLFQPAEEKAQGAQQLIKAGALNGVQAIFGMHNKPDLPVGTIGITGGPLMAAADGFIIEVEGLESHAAVPDAGLDPIVTAAHIVTALQSIVSRNVSPLQSAVVSVTQIHSGTTWNIIPGKAVLEGTIRTFDEHVRLRVLERFQQVVEGVGVAFGAQVSLRWIEGPPPVVNDEAWASVAKQTADELGFQSLEPVPSPAGEDFAFYQRVIPGLFVFMGTAGSREWHHPAFDLDEQALPVSVAFFSALAKQALERLEEAGGNSI